MAISMHYVNVGTFTTDSSGNRIDKSSGTHSINTMLNTRLETLIIPAGDVPNSSSYPTIKAFLAAEADDGYVLYHLDQSICITYNTNA
jgi:hypothetical protein